MAEFETNKISTEYNEIVRPSKRRKFYRKRFDGDDHEDVTATYQEDAPSVTALTLDELVDAKGNIPNTYLLGQDSSFSVTEILRQRKAAQRRRGGIEFTNVPTTMQSGSATPQRSRAVVTKEDTAAELEAVVNRFAPQTGQVADVDKHMMAYIDSELAKRRQGQEKANLFGNGYGTDGLAGPGVADLGIQRQPAALGKLHEIDLGPDATLKNIERTEAAKRRLEGGEEEVEEVIGKVRLRRDGKPWKGRRRRNSEDVKRDQLVEEVLRESRLEIYDEPEIDAANDDQAADDRIAEEFRREFMDAVSSRRQKTGTSTSTKPVKGAKVDDKPKGPKLGGSRSARAAMRELQEQAEKKRK